jgi:acyl-CoA synthetase (AMP-forming)/AMP-acid ligase II
MRFLPTGDIGALVNGELVPIDRISDTIILYGTKIHAADMEAAVMEQAEEFGLHAAVAFAVDDGAREQAVVLCERGRRPGRVGAADALAAAVAAAFGVVPIVGLVPHGSLPRTSSGKLQRHAARTQYLSGAFGASRPAPVPSNPAEIERHAE